MVCIHCGSETRVVNSRLQKRLNQVWRRRKCLACGALVSTHEVVQYELTWLVQNGTRLKPFSRDRLFLSIYASCQHRSDTITDAASLTETVIAKLRLQSHATILDSRSIVQTVQVALNRFDSAASTHYRAFHR